MINTERFIDIAKSFEESVEQPHFEKLSYRVNKKIFATLDTKSNTAVLKLTPEEQSEFCESDDGSIFPAAGQWGKIGYTCFELNKLSESLVLCAVTKSYCNVAPKKISQKYSGLKK